MAPCPSCGHDGSSGTGCARCGASLAGPPTRDREEVDRLIAEAGPLELDPQWVAARAAKPVRPRRGKLVALVAVGLVAVAVAVVVVSQRSGAKPPRAPGAGVSIRIVATPPVEVTIDGARAGKTPLVLSRPISTTPIIVAAPSVGRMKQIVPDHDQTVDLAPPD